MLHRSLNAQGFLDTVIIVQHEDILEQGVPGTSPLTFLSNFDRYAGHPFVVFWGFFIFLFVSFCGAGH